MLMNHDGLACRYLVVLRLGGVYADVDTECKRPLDPFIQPKDTLVAGWENEFPTPHEAIALRHYARTRQVSHACP